MGGYYKPSDPADWPIFERRYDDRTWGYAVHASNANVSDIHGNEVEMRDLHRASTAWQTTVRAAISAEPRLEANIFVVLDLNNPAGELTSFVVGASVAVSYQDGVLDDLEPHIELRHQRSSYLIM